MKTHPVTAILTSAYLSAMLTSSVAPINSKATLAAAIDPMAAQKALQNAASGLDAAGWAAAVADIPTPSQATPTPIPVKMMPKADPAMTAELMARLIKLAEDQTEIGSFSEKVCAIFNLCDGTATMPAKIIETERPEGHYLIIPRTPGLKDIVIINKKTEGSVITLEAYLTDKNFKLRAAAVSSSNTPAHLITNEKAAEKFKAELAIFAREAVDLPPAGTAVAGNS